MNKHNPAELQVIIITVQLGLSAFWHCISISRMSGELSVNFWYRNLFSTIELQNGSRIAMEGDIVTEERRAIKVNDQPFKPEPSSVVSFSLGAKHCFISTDRAQYPSTSSHVEKQ
ncbi:unnamed protein product [Caenorhabditis brenneri]